MLKAAVASWPLPLTAWVSFSTFYPVAPVVRGQEITQQNRAELCKITWAAKSQNFQACRTHQATWEVLWGTACVWHLHCHKLHSLVGLRQPSWNQLWQILLARTGVERLDVAAPSVCNLVCRWVVLCFIYWSIFLAGCQRFFFVSYWKFHSGNPVWEDNILEVLQGCHSIQFSTEAAVTH